MLYSTMEISSLPLQIAPKVFAHTMLWFGTNKHKGSGYRSDDIFTISRQLDQMKASGIGGVVLSYYGVDVDRENQAARIFLYETALRGMSLIISLDVGIVRWAAAGVDKNALMAKNIQYILDSFAPMPNYYRHPDGRPLFLEFGTETQADLDMAKVTGQFPQCAFVYRNKNGLLRPSSSGNYSWMDIKAGAAYLSDFYSSKPAANQFQFGSAYMGFDDHDPANPTQSIWGGAARYMDAKNGSTFLESLGLAVKQPGLVALQLATWNDYEEGTALEKGIDNAVAFSRPVLQAGNLNWTTTGNLDGVDSIEVVMDNQTLSIVKANATSIELPIDVAFSSHKLQLRAVGKPLFLNKYSEPVSLNVGWY